MHVKPMRGRPNTGWRLSWVQLFAGSATNSPEFSLFLKPSDE